MLFGGYDGSSRLSRIAAYMPSTNEWMSEGNMRTPRDAHGVINLGNAYFIIGGDMEDHKSSEKCRYVNDQLRCMYQNPIEPNGEYKV